MMPRKKNPKKQKAITCSHLPTNLFGVIERKVKDLQENSRISGFDLAGTVEFGSVVHLRVVWRPDESLFAGERCWLANVVSLVFCKRKTKKKFTENTTLCVSVSDAS